MNHCINLVFIVFETGSCFVAHTGKNFLPPRPECCDYRHVPPQPAQNFCISDEMGCVQGGMATDKFLHFKKKIMTREQVKNT
jgi:hypothetical protein